MFDYTVLLKKVNCGAILVSIFSYYFRKHKTTILDKIRVTATLISKKHVVYVILFAYSGMYSIAVEQDIDARWNSNYISQRFFKTNINLVIIKYEQKIFNITSPFIYKSQFKKQQHT